MGEHEKSVNYNKTKYSAGILCLLILLLIMSTALVFTAIPSTLTAQVTMEVYQQSGNKAFGKNTSLDIFDSPKLGGKKLVAPYSHGSYTFAVFNSSNSNPLPYTLGFSSTNPENIPLVFSLKKNGVYIYGGASKKEMLPLSEFNLKEAMLGGKKTDLFTIEWMWRTENDIIDTALGDDGTQKYSLFINAVGTVSEAKNPKTGDDSNIILWSIILCFSAIIMLFILFFKRKKSENDKENEDIVKNT